MVDLSASQIDAEFASHSVDCQPNYAIGVFKDRKLMLTPLKKFQQVRPSFEHVDIQRQKNTIQTREQQKADQASKDELKRVGVSRTAKKDAGVIDLQWHDLQVVDSKRDTSGELKK